MTQSLNRCSSPSQGDRAQAEMVMTPKRLRGRPSKGPRKQVKGEVPTPLAERFRDDANRLGKSHADYLAHVLAVYYKEQDQEATAA